MIKVKESCACGASFSLKSDAGAPSNAMERVEQWYERHMQICSYWDLRLREQEYYRSIQPAAPAEPLVGEFPDDHIG